MSNKERKDFQYYKRLFDAAHNFDPNRGQRLMELAAFYEGEQDLLTVYNDDKPWVVDVNAPYASDAIDIRVASLQSSDYIGELEPLSPDDVEPIRLLNQVYQNTWKEINMDKIIDESIQTCAVLKEAYCHIVFDNEKPVGGTNTLRYGVLKPYLIEPSAIKIDPNALNLRDADYFIVTERISRKQAEQRYGIGKEETIGGTFTAEERGEVFLGNEYHAEQDKILTKWTVYERDVIKNNVSIYKTVLIDNKIVSKRTKLEIPLFPIAQLRWKKKFKSPYGLSLMDRLLGLQKSVNSIESATTNTALQFAAPSFVIKDESGINAEEFASVVGAPGVVLKARGDVNQAVRQLITNSVDESLIKVSSKNEATIYKIAGASEQFIGNIGTAGNTKSGTEQALNRAKIIEHNFLPNLEEYVEDITNILVQYIVRVFAGKTVYSRGKKRSDGSYDFEEFNVPEGLEDLNYTFAINLDVKTPYSKEKTKTLIQELFQIEQQYDSPVKVINVLDILEQYDIPNKQELIARYKELMAKDTETKAAVITQFVTLASKYGIDLNLITQGISEIIEGKETPTVDAITQNIQQMIVQQEQAQMQAEQQLMNRQLQAQSQMEEAMAEPTGDEVFEAEPEPTGDEVFEADIPVEE